MRTRTFFRTAVLLPLLFLLALWCWEPRLWQDTQTMASDSFGMQAMAFAKSWLLMGGGQYILSAGVVLWMMEYMDSRSQLQLLFALCPMIFFLICGAISLLENLLLTSLGVYASNAVFGGVLLALATLTLGSVYVFIMSVAFIWLKRRRPVREPLPPCLPALGD